MNPLLWLPVVAGWSMGAMLVAEHQERWRDYQEAEAYARARGKPTLRIGMRRLRREPPETDYTVDIRPAVLTVPGGVLADVRCLPFPDLYFGACLVQHVLEHLDSPQAVEDAMAECYRVAELVWVMLPGPGILNALHPDHHLIVRVVDGRVVAVKP